MIEVGFSASFCVPAVWKDALFVSAQEGDRLLLLRLDRADGKVVWQRQVGKGTPSYQGPPGPGRFHDEQNMASPSPVTDGKRVFARSQADNGN